MWPFKFHSVGVARQRTTCQAMGLKFVKANGVSPGSGDTLLTWPDMIMRSIKKIRGGGGGWELHVPHCDWLSRPAQCHPC